MKRIFLAAMFTGLMMGCSESKKASIETTVSADKGVEVDYSYKDKNKFVEKMKDELKSINAELEKLGRDVKAESKPQWEKLKEKSKNLEGELAKVENATEGTWNDVKAGSKKAFEDMKEGFRDARDWTAEKIGVSK